MKSHFYGFFVDCSETKTARPAENFIDLVTTMSVVSYPCSFKSLTDVLLEILK